MSTSEPQDGTLASKATSDVESKQEDEPHQNDLNADIDNHTQQSTYKFAEGGTRAWLVAFGCWCTSFTSFGYINSFGIYETYYLQTYLSNHSPSEVAWIGSIQVFMLFLATIVSGPATDRFGASMIIRPSSLVLVVATMLTSLCREYYQFILCQGMLTGICAGIVYSSAMVVVGQYFHKKRAMAMAFASTGSPLGGVIYPIIINNTLNKPNLGFPWGQRVCGFLSMFLLLIAALALRPTGQKRKSTFNQVVAFKKPAYSLQIVGLFLVVLGLWTPYLYIGNSALANGISPDLAFYLFALINAGSFVGRVLSGFFAERLGKWNLLSFACYGCSMLIFCWLIVHSTGGFVVLAILYGSTSGIVVAMMMATIASCADDPREIGAYVGVAVFLIGFAALAGTPITGTLVKDNSHYMLGVIFSGAVLIAGAVVTTLARLAFDRKKIVV